MQLKDVMTRDVQVICPDATIEEAASMMKKLNVGTLPVCDNNRLVGMVTDRDLTIRGTAAGGSPQTTKVRDVMTPGIVYCFEDQDVSEAAKLMTDKQIRRLVVLDRNKKLVGILSLGDLAVDTHDEHLISRAVEGISEPSEPTR